MIPLQLTIEGLYSYQERQTIDFETLTDAGLFGIFGAVGSGKSSILEAISYALYGETERLNSKEKRAYNMMNLKSSRSYIAFDFINFENRKFRVTREFRRNSKRFDDVKPSTVVFYEEKEEQLIPIEHTNAEKIVGLSYANFKRTIIIPQGQFREFIELGATDRTKMMKELFQLQRFDLHDKTAALAKSNQSALDILEGKLSGFDEINEAVILEKENLLRDEQTKFDAKEKEFKEKENSFSELKQLRADFQALADAEQIFSGYQNNEGAFKIRETKLQRYEKTERLFRNLLERLHQSQREQKDIETDLNEAKKSENEVKHQLQTTEKDFITIEKDYSEQLPMRKKQIEDWKRLIAAKDLENRINNEQERTEKGQKSVAASKESQALLQKESEAVLKKLTDARSRKKDTAVLLEIDAWFTQKKAFEKEGKLFRDEIVKLKKETEILSEEKKKLPDDWKLHFENEEKTFKHQKATAEEKLQHLLVTKKLEEYALHLHNGDPCPLCGALEHPNPASEKSADNEIEALENTIRKLNGLLEQLVQKIHQLEKTEIQIEEKERQTENLKIKLNNSEKEFEHHQKQFVWSGFSADDEAAFSLIKKESLETENEIKSLEQESDNLRQKLEKQQSKTEKYQQELKKIDDEILIFSAQKNQEISKITELVNPEELLNCSAEQMTDKKEALEKNVAETERSYLETQKKINTLKPLFASCTTKTAQLTLQKEKTDALANEIQNEIEKTLTQEHFTSLGEVREILKIRLDTERERQEILQFRSEYTVAGSKVSELQKKVNGKTIDQKEFDLQQIAFDTLKKEFDTAIGLMATLRSDLSRIQKQFADKKELLIRQTTLKKRAENLRIMTNLFKGAGFVQYVSSVYLRQLCDHANVRFHRMTRNQLSLQINENNDFEIIDYLNEGHSRSIKTLSGGQMFQVSLSLALALAESVQSAAQAEKNFFFIDEGFGTLDPESVNTVFETLTNLRKENRIVGIISHVDELKERMPVSLNIIKDEAKGSLIKRL